MRYTVENLQGETYQVFDEDNDMVYQGQISDCESWIRLTNNGIL